MQSLAEMLMGKPVARKSAPRPMPEKFKDSAYTFASLERNADKPCTKCEQPRHRAKSGRVYTTLCTTHYLEAQARQWDYKRKENK